MQHWLDGDLLDLWDLLGGTPIGDTRGFRRVHLLDGEKPAPRTRASSFARPLHDEAYVPRQAIELRLPCEVAPAARWQPASPW